MFRLNALAVAACMLGGCAQMPPGAASRFAAVPAPVIIDRYGITRAPTVHSVKACLTRETTTERSAGRSLPCADNHNSSTMAEHHNELIRDGKLLPAVWAGWRRPLHDARFRPAAAEAAKTSVRATNAAAVR
jgi:hypothetical protein